MSEFSGRFGAGAAALGLAFGLAIVGIPAAGAAPSQVHEVHVDAPAYHVNDRITWSGTCLPAGEFASDQVTVQFIEVATGTTPYGFEGGADVESDGSFSGWTQASITVDQVGPWKIRAVCSDRQSNPQAVMYTEEFQILAAGEPLPTTSTSSTSTTIAAETSTSTAAPVAPATEPPPAAAVPAAADYTG